MPFWNRNRHHAENTGAVQPGSYTLRSHGVHLLKTHKYDWLILALVGILTGVVHLLPTFHRYVDQHMMNDLDFPLKGITVHMWIVPIFCIVLPILTFFVVYYRRRDAYDLHHSTLGLLYAVLVTGAITGILKDVVGRPRPDFFWRCFPDGRAVYNQVTGDVICHGKSYDVKDGYRSFPSGHTSWSFAGCTFLSLYLAGHLRLFDRKAHMAKVCLVVLPLIFATLIGISVIDDYAHNWSDVLAGALLGTAVGLLCYHAVFPPPYHANGWAPWAYFRKLDEARAGGDPRVAANQRAEGNTLDELEAGRMAANHDPANPHTGLYKGLSGAPLQDKRAFNEVEAGKNTYS